MLRRYTFWLTAAILFMFVCGILHLIAMILPLKPGNADEATMVTLLTTLQLDMGNGFRRTFFEIHTALSVCFTLVCLLGGLLTGWLLIKDVDPNVMKGVIAIDLAIFGVLFLVMAWFTFVPPILMTGLIFFNLLPAYFLAPKIEVTLDEF